jgi:hypothetical protein
LKIVKKQRCLDPVSGENRREGESNSIDQSKKSVGVSPILTQGELSLVVYFRVVVVSFFDVAHTLVTCLAVMISDMAHALCRGLFVIMVRTVLVRVAGGIMIFRVGIRTRRTRSVQNRHGW